MEEKKGHALVHHDPVVVLPSCVSAASGMLAVLSDTAVARRDVAALLAVLAEACGSGRCGCLGMLEGRGERRK